MTTNIFFFIQATYFLYLFFIYMVPRFNLILLKKITLFITYMFLLEVIFLGYNSASYDLVSAAEFINVFWITTNLFSMNYIVAIDTLSYIFMLLTAFLIPLGVISSWNNIKFNLREFFIILITIEWILFNMFMVTDLFLFYIWFEAILIPMYFLIGVWGSRQRKTYASFMFFFYTFVGSLFLLFALFILYTTFGTLQLTNLLLISTEVSKVGFIVWPLIMFAFAVKVPMFPAHIWLPEAHVEAPTVGSVLLAGILLKLGIFAVLRFLIPIFPTETQYFAPVISIAALIGILYISLTTLRQIDLKKIIAYASVAHMNYVVLGVFGTNILSLVGSIFLMIGHGIVSAGLFFMIGFLYDRYKTRNIRYYRGMVQFMPIYALFLFIFSLANMSFPGTVNFIGEALILFGVFQSNVYICFGATFGIIFCAIYTIWLFNRTMYGPITPAITLFSDLSFKEVFVLLPLLILTVYLGLFPNDLLIQFFNLIWMLIEYY